MMVVSVLRRLRSPLPVPAFAYLAGSSDCPLALRLAAAEGLRDAALSEAAGYGRLHPLLRALQNPDPRLSATAADVMARTPWGMQELRWRAQDERQHVRQAVCAALGDHGDASDVAVLSELLAGDGDIIVRRAAATALGKLGGDAAAGALIEALADQRMCEAAASAIAALGTAPSGALRRLAEHGTGRQRCGAVTALGLMGDRQVAPLLLDMLSSQDLPLRIAAVDALGRLRYHSAASGLARILDDQGAGGRVRARAAWALGQLAGDGGVDRDGVVSLVAALDDPIESVRLRAAEALASVPDELRGGSIAEALARVAAGDPVADVRHAAVVTLAALGPVGRQELRLQAPRTSPRSWSLPLRGRRKFWTAEPAPGGNCRVKRSSYRTQATLVLGACALCRQPVTVRGQESARFVMIYSSLLVRTLDGSARAFEKNQLATSIEYLRNS